MGVINNYTIEEDIDDSRSVESLGSQREKCDEPGVLFTPEQQQAIMAMI